MNWIYDKNTGNTKLPLIAVAGPTASGKSALAMRLCEYGNGELVSCDSMQVYRRMDIGTAKPTRAERAHIPHHLIDICEPDEDFSVATFTELADAAIREITSRGKLPILCGGTGLYMDSLLFGVGFGELQADPDYRAELSEYAEKNGVLALHDKLAKLDPEAASAIHPNNVKRVIRALEICRFSGMSKTEWDKKALANEAPYDACILALDYRDRNTLYQRIESRVDQMLADGLEVEVRTLLEEGYLTPASTAGGAIGYKELIGYIDGHIDYEEMVCAVKLATRRYAKRQLTWLRRNPKIHWLFPDDYENFEGLFEAACQTIAHH